MLRHCYSSHDHQSMAPSSTPFSLFFPTPKTMPAADGFDDDSHSSVTTGSPSSPSSSTGSVDCTLSLGTPSSRRAAADTAAKQLHPASSCAAVSWDVAAAAAVDQSYCYCCCCQGGSMPAAAVAVAATAMNKNAVPCTGHGYGHGHDPMLVDRRCANCGTSSTPLWRNGPRGPKSLCNACGIRFKKEERRAAATATATATATAAAAMDHFAQRAQYGAAAAAGRAAPVPYGGCEWPAFPCGGGDIGTDAEAVPPQFLTWRLDVVAPAQAAAFSAVWPERTTLFQYN